MLILTAQNEALWCSTWLHIVIQELRNGWERWEELHNFIQTVLGEECIHSGSSAVMGLAGEVHFTACAKVIHARAI